MILKGESWAVESIHCCVGLTIWSWRLSVAQWHDIFLWEKNNALYTKVYCIRSLAAQRWLWLGVLEKFQASWIIGLSVNVGAVVVCLIVTTSPDDGIIGGMNSEMSRMHPSQVPRLPWTSQVGRGTWLQMHPNFLDQFTSRYQIWIISTGFDRRTDVHVVLKRSGDVINQMFNLKII